MSATLYNTTIRCTALLHLLFIIVLHSMIQYTILYGILSSIEGSQLNEPGGFSGSLPPLALFVCDCIYFKANKYDDNDCVNSFDVILYVNYLLSHMSITHTNQSPLEPLIPVFCLGLIGELQISGVFVLIVYFHIDHFVPGLLSLIQP